MCACVRVRARACARAFAYVWVCVWVCVRTCIRVCVHECNFGCKMVWMDLYNDIVYEQDVRANLITYSSQAVGHVSATGTSAVLRLECSIDCISGSVGHQQNSFHSFSHCQRFF